MGFLSYSYAKILEETNFQPLEFPRSGSKDGEKIREKERTKVGNINGQLHIVNATSGGARKPPGPILYFVNLCQLQLLNWLTLGISMC